MAVKSPVKEVKEVETPTESEVAAIAASDVAINGDGNDNSTKKSKRPGNPAYWALTPDDLNDPEMLENIYDRIRKITQQLELISKDAIKSFLNDFVVWHEQKVEAEMEEQFSLMQSFVSSLTPEQRAEFLTRLK